MKHHSTNRPTLRLIVGAAALIAALSGCNPPDTPDLAHAKSVAAGCPKGGQQVAALVASDESGSRRGSTAQPVQQAVIRDVAERTAICGGHLRVAVFAGSVVTVPVYDGDLQLDGATDTARLRKASKVTDDVIRQVNDTLPNALTELSDGATDIVAQHQLAAEYRLQLAMNGRYHLESTVLTDGIQTAQVNLEDPSLTTDKAKELAATVTVPDLSGGDVRVIGIGRQADGEQLPTPYVEALRAFHLAVCTRTAAAQCLAVTDAAGA
jgi:hypothetical protein